MSGPQFFQTGYGRSFFEHQLPTAVKHLGSIATELKRANDLKELELNVEGQKDSLGKQEENVD